jgi:hypothetical protein
MLPQAPKKCLAVEKSPGAAPALRLDSAIGTGPKLALGWQLFHVKLQGPSR